ncbi:partial Succinyl-diaminopimelate desuccinylase, partial [Rhodocyclaceae bacterium]
MSNTLQLAKQLIARRSLTPLDEGCLTLIGERLEPLGFKLETMRCGEVDN